MNYRLSLLLMAMIFYTQTLHADEQIRGDSPAIDFLEFLGEWETSDGEWLDPNELEDEAYAGPTEANSKDENNE